MPVVSYLSRRWPLLALTLAGMALHGRQLLGERLYWRDTRLVFGPAKHYLAELLNSGTLPVWYPWESGGTPFLAQPQMSLFHPSTLLYLLLPFWTAFAGQDLVATWLALFGVYVLGRELGQERSGAFVAAVVFASSGYLISLTEHTFMKLSAGGMPWYLWALLRAHRRGGSWLLAPSLAMALILFGGDPTIAILSTLCGAALLLVESEGRTFRASLIAVLAPVGGALLAAVQLIPALSIVSETERGGDIISKSRWPLMAGDVFAAHLPLDLGRQSFARYLYLGFPLALVWGATRSSATRRQRWLLGSIIVASIWLALGDDYGLNRLFRAVVPLWSMLRYPIKAVILVPLALALFAGFGRPHGERPRYQVGLLLVASMAVWSTIRPLAVDPIVYWTTLVAAFTAVVTIKIHRRPEVAGLLLALHFVTTGAQMLLTKPASFYDEPVLAGALRQNGVSLTGPYLERIDSRAVRDDLYDEREMAAVGGASNASGAFWRLPMLTYYNAATSHREHAVFQRDGKIEADTAAKLYGIYGVGYLVVPEEFAKNSGAQVLGLDEKFSTVITPLRRSLPRAYGAHRAVTVESATAAAALVSGNEFKPGREIVVEGVADPSWSIRPDERAVPVEISGRTNGSVTMKANLPWPGFVVLNEAAYKGWSVTVDGTPARSLIANVFVRAVEVPAGQHEIVWHYEVPGLVPGTMTTILTMLSMAAAFVWLRRQGPPATSRSLTA